MIIEPNNGQSQQEAAQEFVDNVELVDDMCNAYAVEIGVPSSWVTCVASVINRRLKGGQDERRLTVSTNVQVDVTVAVPGDSTTTPQDVVSSTNALTAQNFETFVEDSFNANGVTSITLVQVGELTDAVIVGSSTATTTSTTVVVVTPDGGGGSSGASAGLIVLIVLIVLFVLACPLILFLIYFRLRQNHAEEQLSIWEVFFGKKDESAALSTDSNVGEAHGGWVDHDV